MLLNYACTRESVPLAAAIMLMIKTYRLNTTIQIHNAYVSVITCVRSVRLRQVHNSEGVYATRRWHRQLRAVALQTTLQPIAASASFPKVPKMYRPKVLKIDVFDYTTVV